MEFVIENDKLLEVQNPDQDVHIPEGVKSLAGDVFNSLKEVRNVWFPSSLVDYHGYRVLLFRHQENIFVHQDNPVFASHEGVLYNRNLTRLLCCPMKKQGTYKLAPSTRTISTDAFCCSSLDEIILNDGLETIERTVFAGRWHMKWIYIPESVSQIDEMAFDGEWTSQGILVKRDSYAHKWARRFHERLYKCVDFDEEADKQKR